MELEWRVAGVEGSGSVQLERSGPAPGTSKFVCNPSIQVGVCQEVVVHVEVHSFAGVRPSTKLWEMPRYPSLSLGLFKGFS